MHLFHLLPLVAIALLTACKGSSQGPEPVEPEPWSGWAVEQTLSLERSGDFVPLDNCER